MIGLGIGIAALGVAIGLGLIGYSAMQGMSRQPEAIGRLQTAMLIALAFVELVFLLTVFIVPSAAGQAEATARGTGTTTAAP
ncbi:F0F1 ATP synthase subunit C [bacterium]|nr:MAG: F0F1 ATP synthase subunit C [bacterium]